MEHTCSDLPSTANLPAPTRPLVLRSRETTSSPLTDTTSAGAPRTRERTLPTTTGWRPPLSVLASNRVAGEVDTGKACKDSPARTACRGIDHTKPVRFPNEHLKASPPIRSSCLLSFGRYR